MFVVVTVVSLAKCLAGGGVDDEQRFWRGRGVSKTRYRWRLTNQGSKFVSLKTHRRTFALIHINTRRSWRESTASASTGFEIGIQREASEKHDLIPPITSEEIEQIFLQKCACSNRFCCSPRSTLEAMETNSADKCKRTKLCTGGIRSTSSSREFLSL